MAMTVENLAGTYDVKRSIRRHVLISLAVMVLLVGGIGGWAATTNLAGAVVTHGIFVVDSNLKRVQHPTGGIVGEILVRDGARVEAGQVVLRLDATQTRAHYGIVTRRLDELRARRARLEAEMDGLAEIIFPEDLLERASEEGVATAMRSETRLFEARRASREGQIEQLRQRIEQLGHEIEGYKAKAAAFTDGLAVLEREIVPQRELLEKGLASTQRLNALEAQAATYGGERGEAIALQAQAAGRITETELQILSIGDKLQEEVGRELREIQAQIGEYTERRTAVEDELKRIDLIAPQSGIVHELAVHTVGGVISPAEVVMLIVPDHDKLALEVRVSPQDIDQVVPGQEALLRLSAFNQRTTPELTGHVSLIAADLTHDQRSGMAWYVVRISVPPEELARLEGLTLVPGMPAEALIRTGDRTALSYIVKPLSDSFNRAFRE